MKLHKLFRDLLEEQDITIAQLARKTGIQMDKLYRISYGRADDKLPQDIHRLLEDQFGVRLLMTRTSDGVDWQCTPQNQDQGTDVLVAEHDTQNGRDRVAQGLAELLADTELRQYLRITQDEIEWMITLTVPPNKPKSKAEYIEALIMYRMGLGDIDDAY